MKSNVFSKVVERVGQLELDDVQKYLGRLAREQGFLETIFHAIREGILVTDEDAVIRYFNPAAALFLGLSENAIGDPLERHVRGLDWRSLVAEGGSSTRNLEVTYPERRFLNIYTIPLTPEARDGLGCALVLHDATPQREAIREVAESERMNAITLLAAGVAHELGNPINSFGIQLQLMERECRKLPDAKASRLKRAIQVAQAEIKRLDGIIRQFLQAVRPTKSEMRPLNVNPLVKESLAFLAAEMDDRDLLVEQKLSKKMPLVNADAGQLKQVFYNLIRNALQAMPPGGILHVCTRADEEGVVVSFKDTGGGIAPETMSRLFEPYHTTKKEGTGLGLFIVRRIVREHHGKLEIDSQLGQGTEVRIRLPIPGTRVKLLAEQSKA